MTTPDGAKLSAEEFTRILDVYGADRDRWPEEVRCRVEALLASDKSARYSLAQMQAVEHLLEDALCKNRLDLDKTEQHALVDRIVTAALLDDEIKRVDVYADSADRKPAAPQDRLNVIDLPAFAKRSGPEQDDSLPLAPPVAFESGWRSALLLAASLIIGIYIGFSSKSFTTTQVLAEVASLAAGSEAVPTAYDANDIAEFDEEAL